jgi:protein ImuA
MLADPAHRAFEALRAEIAKIEAGGRVGKGVLPFGIPELDARLPGGGLPLGALHEVAGGGIGAVDGATSALFAASLAARTQGQVLWCITRPDLFAPALFQAGLAPERVIYLEAGDDKTLLACCEEGLRHGGLGAVVGEVSRLSSTASRAALAASAGRGGLWSAHGGDHTLAGQPSALIALADPRGRPGALVCRAHPLQGGRALGV